MDSSASEITHAFPPFFLVHKDGSIKRFMVADYAPPTVDPLTGVEIKDVVISLETGVKARIFLPKINVSGQQKKLPLIIHYHGGGFCIGSSLDVITTRMLTVLTSVANSIAISIDYRLAPEHLLPIAFDDSWSALQWISTHLNREGPELWLNQFVDFERVFLLGESAGATIAHHMAVRVGTTKGLEGLRIRGAIIVHPYFVDNDQPDELVRFLSSGPIAANSDPKLNPKVDTDLDKMCCEKVLVFVAENDGFGLKPRGVEYCETLKNSGWKGDLELVENEGEDHCFHVFNPTCESALVLVQKVASFVNQD